MKVMEYSKLRLLAAIIAFLCFDAYTSFAQVGAPADHSLTLRSAVELAMRQNPALRAAQLQVQRAQLEVRRLSAETRTPDLRLSFRTGAVPQARGDIFSSPDTANGLRGWGPFYKVDVALVQPIYTFGKISSALQAARHGVAATESGRDRVADELSFEVTRSYLALVFAGRSIAVTRDLREAYEELLSKVDEELAKPDSEVDYTDQLEVQTVRYAVEEAYRLSLDRQRVAKQRLVLLLGLDWDAGASAAEVTTPEFTLTDEHLSALVTAAERSNATIRALRSAVDILESKVDLSKANLYPNVVLVGGFRYGLADNRTDQTNPFVLDNFNYRHVGAFIAVNWDLNFLKHRVEIQQRRTERDAAEERLDAAADRVTMEVQEAFAEARTHAALLEVAGESVESAETWLRVSWDNWDLGIADVGKLLDAYNAFFRLRGIEIEREFGLNVALARLAMTFGDPGLYLKWVDDGVVASG